MVSLDGFIADDRDDVGRCVPWSAASQPFFVPYSPECVVGESAKARTKLRWMACLEEVLEAQYRCKEEAR